MVEREEERIVDKKRDKEVIHITWGCNGETDRERRQRGTVSLAINTDFAI